MFLVPQDLIGRPVHDGQDRLVGKVQAVYRYPGDQAPWGVAAVVHGWLVKSIHLVDLERADFDDGIVQVPYSKRAIARAPYYVPVVGEVLAEGHAAEVRGHYRAAR